MTRAELMRRMSATEIKEWWAFWRVNPWGQERADLRMARLAWTLHQTGFRGAETDERDFLPDFAAWTRPEPEPDPEQERAAWMGWCASLTAGA